MNVKKILVPVDFSSGSEAALDLATSLARDSGAKLLLTYVQVTPLPVGGGEFMYVEPVPPTDELRARLMKVLPKDPKIPVEHCLLNGDPADCIVKLAEDEKVDFIVMGTHGRRGLTRILMGSVAELVVRWAKCPVVTVKAPKK
ncbi:MAG: universal stress protein [Planctomycetales bacterium]|jgi:nucleotide-binding universal stress UspA family protein|nr:universal stress protein [Planctomycetales bacterium]